MAEIGIELEKKVLKGAVGVFLFSSSVYSW